MLGYLEGVKGYGLWVLGVPGIKIINSRNVLFNEYEIRYLKQDINKSNRYENDRIAHSDMKLAKFDLPQLEYENDNPIHQHIELVLEPVEVNEPQIETELAKLEHTNIQDYQLTRNRERRQIRLNPRYALLNLTDFALVSRKALEQTKPASYEEAVEKILKIG